MKQLIQSLETIYKSAAWISAILILAIAILISCQVFLNFATRVLGLSLPSTIPSYSDFSGFMLAGATFLAMPYTLRSGGHIRVSLVTDRVPRAIRIVMEIFVLVLGVVLAGYAAYFAILLTHESWHYNDLSNGIIPVPLWIPQMVMVLGLLLLTIALLHSLIQVCLSRQLMSETEEAEDV